jgi:hypothetical protein
MVMTNYHGLRIEELILLYSSKKIFRDNLGGKLKFQMDK